jgi:hypothetical protein
MNSQVEEVLSCPITGSKEKYSYIDLGEMPLVNNLSDSREDSISCSKYPLEVQFFPESLLSCLTHNVDPNLMFSEYSYKSGISKPYLDHCGEMFDFLSSEIGISDGDSILDIGGNDGTLLQVFLKKNPNLGVLNVDASTNLTLISREKGIPTINKFWGAKVSIELDKKFNIITSTNVFQHTPPILDYVEGISTALKDRGVWCLEFPYWKSNMETNQYDQIYHEHVYYYLLSPLKKLFSFFNLEIFKAVKYPIHGGSLRLLIGKIGSREVCKEVESLLQEEEKMDLYYYKTWGKNIFDHILKCREFLVDLKKEGNNIVGFGAAAKGCIFLNSSGIDHGILDVVIDDTDLKLDKFIPGVGIQIKNREYLKNNKVDYMLILAHNFKDRIIESLNGQYSGKYIVLFPEIKII